MSIHLFLIIVLIFLIILDTPLDNGTLEPISSIDAIGAFENIMFSAEQQVIFDHIYVNATLMSFLDPEMSRCVMWKEILSGVIGSHNLNDYRVVNRMNTAISDAREAVIAEQNDQFLFFQHNTPTTTVLAQIDAFLKLGQKSIILF